MIRDIRVADAIFTTSEAHANRYAFEILARRESEHFARAGDQSGHESPRIFNTSSSQLDRYGRSELSTGRMDPRVGSGRVGSRFCRILAGRVGSALRIF